MYLVYPATIYPIIRIKRSLFDNFCCISAFETMIQTINVGLMHDAILRVSLYKVCFTGYLYSVNARGSYIINKPIILNITISNTVYR